MDLRRLWFVIPIKRLHLLPSATWGPWKVEFPDNRFLNQKNMELRVSVISPDLKVFELFDYIIALPNICLAFLFLKLIS